MHQYLVGELDTQEGFRKVWRRLFLQRLGPELDALIFFPLLTATYFTLCISFTAQGGRKFLPAGHTMTTSEPSICHACCPNSIRRRFHPSLVKQGHLDLKRPPMLRPPRMRANSPGFAMYSSVLSTTFLSFTSITSPGKVEG